MPSLFEHFQRNFLPTFARSSGYLGVFRMRTSLWTVCFRTLILTLILIRIDGIWIDGIPIGGIPIGGLSSQAGAQARSPEQERYFKIEVVDGRTQRGVPLIELRTVSNVRYVTDSNGVVAFSEPGLMGRDVFFYIQGHGYSYPADGFGIRGKTLHVMPGGKARLTVERINIAERLYRITGEGIYRDTMLLGEKSPIREPLLNGQVTGQDTVMALPYRGKLYWLYGDTGRVSYPLGNFATSGATSVLPDRGGLDPSVGIDLTYFVNAEGYCRGMAPLKEPGVVWVDGLTTLTTAPGTPEIMLCRYERLKDLGTPLEMGLMRFNEATQTFERLVQFEMKHPLAPQGHPFHHKIDGVEWIYFPTPYPNIRVRADLADMQQQSHYEAYTPLLTGGRYVGRETRLERDAGGKLVWKWKRDTAPLSPTEQAELVKAGKMRSEESPFALRVASTGKSVLAHNGSVYWNAYRKRWIMIFGEIQGSSLLGEIWYAEAEAPEGPWHDATKIVTHDRYTFYNPTQHPFFDQQGGRIIYFEGTYTNQFTGTPPTPATPRYEYNQILYRLDLADPRLHTPTK